MNSARNSVKSTRDSAKSARDDDSDLDIIEDDQSKSKPKAGVLTNSLQKSENIIS